MAISAYVPLKVCTIVYTTRFGLAAGGRVPSRFRLADRGGVVRDAEGKEELKNFGAENVLVQESMTFQNDIAELTQRLETTAVFDGVGAELVNRIAPFSAPI